MNPTQISPNTGRQFVPGARYWLRQSDQYVMPRENSRYEAPKGFVAVVAESTTKLVFDNSPLDAVPLALDPTNPNHVGAAVSHGGQHRMAEPEPAAPRPMPVTLPRATDDHITRQRSLANMAELASRKNPVDPEPLQESMTPDTAVDDTNPSPKSLRPSRSKSGVA